MKKASMRRLIDLLIEQGAIVKEDRQKYRAELATASKKTSSKLITMAEAEKLDTAAYDITDLRIHDLRRTLGSWQAKTGASLPIIGKSLNHKTQQATAIYARLDLDPVRQSFDIATQAMWNAAGIKISPVQQK